MTIFDDTMNVGLRFWMVRKIMAHEFLKFTSWIGLDRTFTTTNPVFCDCNL